MPSRHTLYFTSPGSVTVREEPRPTPAAGEVGVTTRVSGISPGTERLVYRGEAPDTLEADASLDALSGDLSFPVAYGYSAVGRVTQVGEQVDTAWEGRRVFSFQPHTSYFTASPDQLVPLPDTLSYEAAALLPNMETAVNLVLDGRPTIGERVCVFGQGVVGLLVTHVLSQFPIAALITVDLHASRRNRSEAFGASRSLAPDALDEIAQLLGDKGRSTEGEELPAAFSSETETAGEHGADRYAGADLCYELTGQPAVLNDAIRWLGYDGRVVVGSWYGTKRAPINLGDRFHRGRHRIISSQVSTIRPALRGRWDKDRRLTVAREQLARVDPDRLITHRFSLDEAGRAYALLDDSEQQEGSMLQPIFTYDAS